MAEASISDVARLAGVSIGTVSHVINHPERVVEQTTARVRDAMTHLGYVPNAAARQLRVGRSTMVGLIVPDVRNPFFTDVAQGAEDEGARSGLALLLGNAGEDPERERTYLNLFEEHRVRGVLISPSADSTDHVASVRARGTPLVLVDWVDETSISSVSVDDVEGGRVAADHLLAAGRRRLAFVGGSSRVRQVRERLSGAQAAVATVPGARLEVISSGLTVIEGRSVGEALANRAPHDRPEAILAANDLVALGILQSTVTVPAMRVPHDLLIIGYDDIDFAASAFVPLSSVRQPSREIGVAAVRMLLEEARDASAGPRRVRFTPEIVIRESSIPV